MQEDMRLLKDENKKLVNAMYSKTKEANDNKKYELDIKDTKIT